MESKVFLFFRKRMWFLVLLLVCSFLLLLHHLDCKLALLLEFLFLQIQIHLFLSYQFRKSCLLFHHLLFHLPLHAQFLFRLYLLWYRCGVLETYLFLRLVFVSLLFFGRYMLLLVFLHLHNYQKFLHLVHQIVRLN